jgi:hypothetical protein
LLKEAYLAGGTAAALQLGHRISRDLDFFTEQSFDEKQLAPALATLGVQKLAFDVQTIYGIFCDVPFSYFYYKYPLLAKPHTFEGISIADLDDIAAMKIDAIATRGIKRDFIDLYCIIQSRGISLNTIISFYEQKYGMERDMVIHALRSLTYFEDAEKNNLQDRPLELLQKLDWEEVKRFFREEVERTSRKLLWGENV